MVTLVFLKCISALDKAFLIFNNYKNYQKINFTKSKNQTSSKKLNKSF